MSHVSVLQLSTHKTYSISPDSYMSQLFNPQWISNYSLLEQISVEEAFEKHFFDLYDCQQRTLTPKRPTEPDFVKELQSFTNCTLHIASYPSSQS